MALEYAGSTGYAPDFPGVFPITCAPSLTTVLFTAAAGQTYVLMLGTFDNDVPPQQPVGLTIRSIPGKHCWYENGKDRHCAPTLVLVQVLGNPLACRRPSPVELCLRTPAAGFDLAS
jgi:hypothetical protein